MDAVLPAPWGAKRPNRVAGAIIWASRHTPLGRGAARKRLFTLFERLHGGPVDILLDGARVRLHPGRNVSERKALMRPDKHDAAERAFLREGMARPGAVFLDIGANAGLYSLDAALHAGEGARVIAIEPNEALLARLRFNEALARGEGRIRPSVAIDVRAVAISDRDGEAYLEGGDEGSGGITSAGRGRLVETRALVGLLADLGVAKIDILKIDVEGHEDRALLPFLAAAPSTLLPHALIVEHLSRGRWLDDCLGACEARGYRALFKTRNNTVFTRESA